MELPFKGVVEEVPEMAVVGTRVFVAVLGVLFLLGGEAGVDNVLTVCTDVRWRKEVTH